MKLLNFATLNVRGLKKIYDKEGSPTGSELSNIITDCEKHNIDAIGLQETHFGALEHLQKEKGYTAFFSNEANNRHHGVCILVKDIYNPTFTRISPRVSAARFRINSDKDILFICGYAPHETLANKSPEERTLFYNDLQKPSISETPTPSPS